MRFGPSGLTWDRSTHRDDDPTAAHGAGRANRPDLCSANRPALERPRFIRCLSCLVVHSAPGFAGSEHHARIPGAFSPSLAVVHPASHDGGRVVRAPTAVPEGDTAG